MLVGSYWRKKLGVGGTHFVLFLAAVEEAEENTIKTS